MGAVDKAQKDGIVNRLDSEASSASGDLHTVIEALYDLPLDGRWRDLQSALCDFWVGPDQTEANVKRLVRHFERAMSYIEHLPPHRDQWMVELFRLPLPACVVDARGQVIEVNAAARDDFQWDEGGEPRFAEADRLAVRDAIANLQEQGDLAVADIHAGGVASSLYLRALDSELYLGVLVLLEMPSQGVSLLVEQFGLTPRELDLALKLAAGNSLDDLARASDVKKSTLRSQLASCFAKLDVASQPALVAKILMALFAQAQIVQAEEPPVLTPFLDTAIHGHPKFAKIALPDGRALGYFEYGDQDGLPVFYLHGSLDTGLFLRSQRLYGQGVRMIAVERPGIGESTYDPDNTPATYARDLVVLADHLGLDAFPVIGRSMGSWDAITLALEAPERVRLVVLAGGRIPPVAGNPHEEALPFHKLLYATVKNSSLMGELLLRTAYLQLRVRGIDQFIATSGVPEIEVEMGRDDMFRRHLYATWMRCCVSGFAATVAHHKLYQDAVGDPPWLDFPTPTVLVHGAEDRNVPLERILEQTASFQQRRVLVLPGVGHALIHVAMNEVLGATSDAWSEVTTFGKLQDA